MSRIDHKNIDEYLFNFFEGNLSPEETKALTGFLHKNPALKADYDAWKNSYVEEPSMVYPNMNTLLKPQAASLVKWGKWLIVLFIAIALPLIYKLSEDSISQMPASSLRQQSGADAGRKQKERLPFVETEKTGKTEQLTIAPLIITETNSGKEAIRQADQLYPVQFFVMESRVIPADLSDSAFSPDSLEIILKPQPAAPKAKGSGKQKKHLKSMNVIRIQNSGF